VLGTALGLEFLARSLEAANGQGEQASMLLSPAVAIALIAIFVVARTAMRAAEQYCNHLFAFKLLAHIRDRVFAVLRKLAPARLESRDAGDLVTMITADVELLEVFFAHTISPVAIAVIFCLAMVIFLALMHPVFAILAILAYILVGVVIPLLVSRYGREDGRGLRANSAQMASVLVDGLRGMRELVQYDKVSNHRERINARSRDLEQATGRLRSLEGLALGGTEAAILAATIVLLCLGAVLVMQGLARFDALALSTVALMSSFGPVVALAGLANNLVQTLAAGERICTLLEEKPIVLERSDGVDLPINIGGIICDDVNFAYGTSAKDATDDAPKSVLKQFNLIAKPAQILGIRGASGCGKSTLLRLMMRFWDVDAGRIAIGSGLNAGDELRNEVNTEAKDDIRNVANGKTKGNIRNEASAKASEAHSDCYDVREINTASLRRSEGFMMQETVLFDDSIANNVRIAKPEASDAEVEAVCRKAALHDFISSLPKGYETRAGELGDALSSGEKQRIGLARILLHDAPILLLDEPTSNLDALNEALVLDCLRKESKGKTVVIVSHRASTMSVTDTVVQM
jgi:ATP-binding cassette subfamily C protein